MTPLPSTPPTQVGPARLAQDKPRPGQARGPWGREQTVRAAPAASNSRAGDSPLHQGAVIEATVEPVLIARHVLLHRDIDEGLIERDARDVGISQIDEALHVLVVAGL